MDLSEARDDKVLGCSGVSWNVRMESAPRSKQTTTPTPHHSISTGRIRRSGTKSASLETDVCAQRYALVAVHATTGLDALPDTQPTVSKHRR